MKHKKKVIKVGNLPTRLPLLTTAVSWLILDRIQAPSWLFGSVGTILFIIWVTALHSMLTERKIDIFHFFTHKEKDNETN